jgi:hypothetical protein
VNQVITARGFWQGPADAPVAAPAPPEPVVNPLAAVPRGTDVASADADLATGSVPPLAYAEQPGRDAASGISALRAAAPIQPVQTATAPGAPPAPAAANGTTVAMKRTPVQASSAIMTAGPSSVAVIKSGAHFQNPWLRAVMLSPSVRRYLTTIALGATDLRTLASLMVKPSSAVLMTFAADPNPGLAPDHFTGAAIVFVNTVNYPTRTASLR